MSVARYSIVAVRIEVACCVREHPLAIYVYGFAAAVGIQCIVDGQHILRIAEALVLGAVAKVCLCDIGSNSLSVLYVTSHVVGQEEIVLSSVSDIPLAGIVNSLAVTATLPIFCVVAKALEAPVK